MSVRIFLVIVTVTVFKKINDRRCTPSCIGDMGDRRNHGLL